VSIASRNDRERDVSLFESRDQVMAEAAAEAIQSPHD
jgi:hypothetical protein